MKFKLNYFSLVVLATLFLTCETEFEANTRILVKGNIVDGLGNPIPNASISVYRGENYVFPFVPLPSFDDEYLLGQNFSDSQGNFAVTSLYDKNLYFKILIDAGDLYSNYLYQSNTENYIPENLTFDLGDLILYKKGGLSITILDETNIGNTLDVTLRYNRLDCIEIYEEVVLNTEESSCYSLEAFNISLDGTNPNFEAIYVMPIGTQVDFIYSLNGGSEITETIIINQDTNVYSFSY